MPRTENAPPRFGWRSFLKHLTSFTALLLAAGVLAGASVGLEPLEARAAVVGHATPRLEIRWPALPGGRPGTWLPRDEQERLSRLAAQAAGEHPDPFSRDPLSRVGVALVATGWFDGEPRVVRTGEGRILVDGRWRTPAAVVRRDGKDRMLSWDARLLPPVYEVGASRLPAIIGPALPAPGGPGPRAGESWNGEDIAAAVELLRTTHEQPWASQVAGVDVSGYSADSSLTIVTASGGRIVWGGRPSRPRLGEVSTKQKLLYLLQLHHDYGRIDAGYARLYVNSPRLQFDASASASAPAPGAAPAAGAALSPARP